MLRVMLTLGFVLVGAALQAQQSFMKTFIVSALKGLDCQMTEEQAARVLSPLGLTEDDTVPVVEAMVAAGEATLSADHLTLTLSPALCRADPAPSLGETPPDIRSAVAQVLQRNGCVLGRENAVVEFLKEGIEPHWGFAAGRDMVALGQASQAPDGRLALTSGACATDR
ncbi:MAG TPA: hypothetical protein VM899_02240 [Rubellimicrobium sp.]|nr:hypothetical protein [Rubellimicrobium sp.]